MTTTPDGESQRPNLDGAWRYPSRSTYLGDMFICDATGSPREHETLYRTPKGRWIAHRIIWTEDGKGWHRRDTWRSITAAAAEDWVRRFHR